MPISKEQARDIAKAFLDCSHELGKYRFAHWAQLQPSQRRQIEDAEWDLLNYSSSFVTTAVGVALTNMSSDLNAIIDATEKAKSAIATIQTVKEVLSVVASLVVLGGAIASQNPAAILGAAQDALKTIQETTG